MKNEKKKAGRPIEKQGRVKIGLSIDGETNELLTMLAANAGKTKSKIFEEAIKVLESREAIVQSRLKTLEEMGDDALMDFDEFIKNRKAVKSEEEVLNVS